MSIFNCIISQENASPTYQALRDHLSIIPAGCPIAGGLRRSHESRFLGRWNRLRLRLL